MVDVADSRKNIQQESVRFRGSISESVGFILAGAINFVNNRQYDNHNWNLNGDFSLVVASEVGDGVFICQEDMEIVGYALYIGQNGSTGSSVICDLHFISSDGTDNGTIFSTKPEIDLTALDGSFSHSNIRDSDSEIPTGHTEGVFSKTQFNRHDAIRFDLDQSTGGSSDLQLTIFFRPR